MSPAPGGVAGERLRVVRAAAMALALLAAGAGLYYGFVDHVLDRGDAVVHESVKSKAAVRPLTFAGAGIACLAASGIVAAGRTLRDRRFTPLLGLGLPLAGGALLGASAFSLGPIALGLGAVLAAPSVLTALLACLAAPTASPGLGRFLLRSWRSTGFLIGQVLLAFAGLSILAKAVPRVPWSSVLAAMAIGTLLQMAAVYVARHGDDLRADGRDHEQRRHVHESPAIRSVAERLHPFVEEGRGAVAYTTLAQELAQVAGVPPAAPAPPTPGPPALPTALSATVTALRCAALAAPLALLVPIVGPAVALLAAGAAAPWLRRTLDPRHEPSSRAWWLVGAALMGLAGFLGVEAVAPRHVLLLAPGLAVDLAWAAAAALAAPYLTLLGATLRERRVPGHLGHLRREHAQRLASRWTRDAARGAGAALAALVLPAAIALASLLTGVPLPRMPWQVLAALAAAGGAWALAAWLAGPGSASHRARLDEAHDLGVRERAAAHHRFLERLETT